MSMYVSSKKDILIHHHTRSALPRLYCKEQDGGAVGTIICFPGERSQRVIRLEERTTRRIAQKLQAILLPYGLFGWVDCGFRSVFLSP